MARLSSVVLLLASVLLGASSLVQASCSSCCNNAGCSSAYDGGSGQCCGVFNNTVPFCCPDGARCMTGGDGWYCQELAPSNCDDCCTRGDCTGAYNGRPGTCCGRLNDVAYCCPESDAQCRAAGAAWECELLSDIQ